MDWRSRGVIGQVRAQGLCGSCASFAATGLVSAMAAIEFGLPNLVLSEADEHFSSDHGADCSGWDNDDALDEIQNRGVLTDDVFPYSSAFDNPPIADPSNSTATATNWTAHFHGKPNREQHCYRISDYHAWDSDDAFDGFDGIDGRKVYLTLLGPMICGFTVFEDFRGYAGGVYHHVLGNELGGHSVLVVGFSDPEQAWICRNSWGPGFGGPARPDGTGAGFFKIGYGECDIDSESFYGCHGVSPVRQGDWHWCKKCQCLNFAGNVPGPCKGGGVHDNSSSGNYFLVVNTDTYPAQNNWRWCNKCQCLSFAGSQSLGLCAAGGQHDHGGSGDYRIPEHAAPGNQSNWRWCDKCQCLSFAGGQSVGPCAAGGTHSHGKSGDYSIGGRG